MKKLSISAIALALCAFASANTINLSGAWSVKLAGDSATHTIFLPGTTDIAGLGEPNTLQPELKKPQLLRLTRRHRFVGEATYERSFSLPANMAGKPLELKLERAMWRTRVAIDSVELDRMQESLTTPHTFLIPALAQGEHTLRVVVDNSKMYDISVDELAHAYTDDTQTKWNGLLGEISLSAVPSVNIANLKASPDASTGAVAVELEVENATGHTASKPLQLTISDANGNQVAQTKVNTRLLPGINIVNATVTLPGKPAMWDEFTPNLYRLDARTGDSRVSAAIGFRTLETTADRLLVNGRNTFLRGTLECCVFPLTGTPPTDAAQWRKLMTTLQLWGLNHIRFHSWCPPEAAFAVADTLGIYLQVELPLWQTKIDGESWGGVRSFIKDEFHRISRTYGNHPSLIMMTCGNELQKDFGWLNEMVAHMKQYDPRRLYAATSFTFEKGHGGHPEPHDDFLVTQWTDKGWVRGQGVFDVEPPAFNRDYATATAALGVPLIEHEIGQYAVYPDLSEIPKYTGTLDPLNFKAVKADLESKGRLHRAPDYLRASGKLAAILYKEEVERALKTPGVAGIQLLGLLDFPGQGTALVGLLNAFGESKGLVDPEWFRQFAAPTVPLAYFEKADYSTGEPFEATLKIANHRTAMDATRINWQIRLDSTHTPLAQGSVHLDSVPTGLSDAGTLTADLSQITHPCKATLSVADSEGRFSNSWHFWIYPTTSAPEPDDVLVTGSPSEALEALNRGATVILSPLPDSIIGMKGKFVPVFWSSVHFPDQAGTMGVVCNPEHPALASFPNDGHTDWQWWHVMKHSAAFNLDSIPGATPIVEMVDNFTTNRPLALAAEAGCLGGKLIISGVDIVSPEALTHPAIKALRHSMMHYAASARFTPANSITPKNLLNLFRP